MFSDIFLKRFWGNVKKSHQCWEWTAGLYDKGYGQTWLPSQSGDRSHRVSWRITYGEIPEGKCVLHRCDNRKCVRPDHLFLGTKKDNADDMVRKKRNYQQRKTHCIYGHEFTEDNTVIRKQKSGYIRSCKTCYRNYRIKRSLNGKNNVVHK